MRQLAAIVSAEALPLPIAQLKTSGTSRRRISILRLSATIRIVPSVRRLAVAAGKLCSQAQRSSLGRRLPEGTRGSWRQPRGSSRTLGPSFVGTRSSRASRLRKVGSCRRPIREISRRPCSGTRYLIAMRPVHAAWVVDRLPSTLYRCAEDTWSTAIRRCDASLPTPARSVPLERRRCERSSRSSPRRSPSFEAEVPVVFQRRLCRAVPGRRAPSSQSAIRRQHPLELLMSGPDARRLNVPACRGCREYPLGSEPTRVRRDRELDHRASTG